MDILHILKVSWIILMCVGFFLCASFGSHCVRFVLYHGDFALLCLGFFYTCFGCFALFIHHSVAALFCFSFHSVVILCLCFTFHGFIFLWLYGVFQQDCKHFGPLFVSFQKDKSIYVSAWTY